MIQDNLQLFSFKFSNLPGCCGLGSGLGQDSNPADFWQIGRILLKNDRISTSFLIRNASKFNKQATLPIIYALNRFASPTLKRKGKSCCQSRPRGQNYYKNQFLILKKQCNGVSHKKSQRLQTAFRGGMSGLEKWKTFFCV
ncbi:hypothetical protein [Aeromonas hydrophila]|uniref:hypothetical protein n=1 Tax=Aeromonas hydrophila TaxID=644 RepID=UPI002B4745A7|nr:hypothetical protein [Aeromonas hydrophila]